MHDIRKYMEPDNGDTFIHRMDPRAKLIVLMAVSIMMLFIDQPETLVGFFALSLAGYALAKVPLRNIKALLLLLALIIWGTIYSQALFYQEHPRTIIFTLMPENSLGIEWDGLHVFREGITYGAIQSLRLATSTSLALLLYWTTDPNLMLSGMILLKVPYGLAFIVMTAIRFVPILVTEATIVFRAQKLKGYRPFKVGNWVRTLFLALVPILSNCIRRSARLAVSVESRSFRPDGSRTCLKSELVTLKLSDKVLIVCCLMLLPLMLFKLLYWLYVNNILYVSAFRWIYEIANRYI